MILRPIAFLMICLVFFSCSNEDQQVEETPAQTKLYFEYSVKGEEGREFVTCMLQYRKDEASTEGINIAPGKVMIDNDSLQADTARFLGVYYEADYPVQSFAGDHEIVFTSATGEEFRQPFSFSPFKIASSFPGTISRKDVLIQLEGLPERETKIRVSLVDTAFMNDDLNRIIPVVNGRLRLDSQMLSGLSNGPIMMEISRDERKVLDKKPSGGGRLILSYIVRKEITLQD